MPVAPGEYLAVHDTGTGAPVVLVPGLLGSAYGFRHLIPSLVAQGHRVVVVDPLGYGASPRPSDGDYAHSTQARRIATALDSLRVREAVLVGHATGAAILLRVAADRPDLTRGVVSIAGGAVETPVTASLRTALRFAPLAYALGGERWARGELARQLRRNSADPAWVSRETVDRYLAASDATMGDWIRTARRMAAARERDPLAPRLPAIAVPVRLLVGGVPDRGGITPVEIAQLRAALRDFAADSVPGSGNFVHEERPDAVLAGVRALTRPAVAAR